MSNTKTIAKNTGWYGLENIIGLAIGYYFDRDCPYSGSVEDGYIIYVMWIASVVSSLGSLVIPATTRKYMAEFLGMVTGNCALHLFPHFALADWRGNARHCGILFWYCETPMQSTGWPRYSWCLASVKGGMIGVLPQFDDELQDFGVFVLVWNLGGI